jgi:hypothetical protein
MGENDGNVAAAATNTTDLVGGRTMTLQGVPLYSSSVSSSAVTGVGSDGCVWISPGNYGTNALIPALTNNFGIELWVNPGATNLPQCIAYNRTTTNSGWGFYLTNGQYRGLFGRVGFVGGATAVPGV